MLKNMGLWDRIGRSVFALIVLVLFLTKLIDGIFALILGVLAMILLLTGFFGFCPLYLPFKFSTRKQV